MKRFHSAKRDKSRSPGRRSRSRSPKPELEPSHFIRLPSKSTSSARLEAPWASQATLKISDCLIQLHEEMINFYDFIQATPTELQARADVIVRMKTIAQEIWPESTVSVFGSYETGLCLPNSDIDLLVSTGTDEPLEELINKFTFAVCKKGMASEINRILSAAVPILKMRDKSSGVYLDICFNIVNGVQGVDVVKEYLQRYPQAKYLICILKYFLKQRGLNDTYSGGVGSFLLFCMVICSIQQHPALRSERQDYRYFTLGHYLLHFLKLFGDELDYRTTGISIRGEGSFFRKSSKNWIYFDKENYLAAECPQNQENDLGKSSYSIELVKKAFLHAYKILCSQSRKIAKTPLGSIIRVDDIILARVN